MSINGKPIIDDLLRIIGEDAVLQDGSQFKFTLVGPAGNTFFTNSDRFINLFKDIGISIDVVEINSWDEYSELISNNIDDYMSRVLFIPDSFGYSMYTCDVSYLYYGKIHSYINHNNESSCYDSMRSVMSHSIIQDEEFELLDVELILKNQGVDISGNTLIITDLTPHYMEKINIMSEMYAFGNLNNTELSDYSSILKKADIIVLDTYDNKYTISDEITDNKFILNRNSCDLENVEYNSPLYIQILLDIIRDIEFVKSQLYLR